jgi:hypothetical protein
LSRFANDPPRGIAVPPDELALFPPYGSQIRRRSSRCRRSSSTARASASGVSGIVSRDEMDGDRDRADVGVLGTDDDRESVRP